MICMQIGQRKSLSSSEPEVVVVTAKTAASAVAVAVAVPEGSAAAADEETGSGFTAGTRAPVDTTSMAVSSEVQRSDFCEPSSFCPNRRTQQLAERSI